MVKLCGPKCSACCSLLSIWGVIMLLLMGIFFRVNAIAFIEDVNLGDVKDLTKEKLESTYTTTSNNCFIAAGIYALLTAVSVWQFSVNRKSQYQVT
ncbi:ribonuclease kappa-like [Amphiura filiformis]|uniref:ribonuclease kappa-like n=1 Tax=Amphiura filiformis TaxID=82378 RepID=UPI003B20F50C